MGEGTDDISTVYSKYIYHFLFASGFSLINNEDNKPNTAIIEENQRVTWIASSYELRTAACVGGSSFPI